MTNILLPYHENMEAKKKGYTKRSFLTFFQVSFYMICRFILYHLQEYPLRGGSSPTWGPLCIGAGTPLHPLGSFSRSLGSELRSGEGRKEVELLKEPQAIRRKIGVPSLPLT